MSLQSQVARPQTWHRRAWRVDAEYAMQEIREYLEGIFVYKSSHLCHEEVIAIPKMTSDELKELLKGKSASSKWIAYHLSDSECNYKSFEQLLSEWKTRTRILKWMRSNEALCSRCGVADVSGGVKTKYYPDTLLAVGVDGSRSSQGFCELYEKVMVKGRVPHSSKQIDLHKVANVDCTPNYNRLPDWVKQGLAKHAPHHAQIGGDRVGNIWGLPTMVKAWKWGGFPKLIANKIGKLPVRFRMVAGLAWEEVREDWESLLIPRSEVIDNFWLEFRNLSNASVLTVLAKINERDHEHEFLASSRHVRTCLEILLEMPYQGLEEEWEQGERNEDDFRRPSDGRVLEIIANYGGPKEACKHLLGCSGKGTVRAYKSCECWDQLKWAVALAYGNADACQKILVQSPQIAFEKDAVEFLLELPMQTRIKLLGCTTFTYRGEECEITDDHVRDTGYLWSNIKNKPELGRVRNWFSVHEQLSAAFVEELPDESLPIAQEWERLNGLSEVNGRWSLEFPAQVATLKHWGKTQFNCVGGYGPAIKQGRSVIFAVREQGLITHIVEYCGDRCRQFYGKKNSSANTEIKSSVQNAIAQSFA